MFEIYRENFQGKYWLPTYISSDDYLRMPEADDLHVRLVVRSTEFKRAFSTTEQGSAQQAPSLTPR
jgi:hypothetical protein